MSIPHDTIIFVTGASRSGTTMLSRILGKHSNVFGLNELHVFGDLIQADDVRLSMNDQQRAELSKLIFQRQQHGIFHADKSVEDSRELNDLVASLPDETNAADVFRHTILAIAKKEGKQIPCEQTPRNIFYAQALLDVYPNAHIVHIVRDPRSVLASQKSKWRRKFLGGSQIPWIEVIRMWCNYHPITLSKLWVKANRMAKLFVGHKRFHLIRFEELLDSPQASLSALCSDIGLTYEEEMLDITHEGSSHQYNANESRGISNSTLDSWKSSLSRAEIHLSQKGCREMMSEYDYQPISNSPSLIDILLVWGRFPLHVIGVIIVNPRRAIIQMKSLLNKI